MAEQEKKIINLNEKISKLLSVCKLPECTQTTYNIFEHMINCHPDLHTEDMLLKFRAKSQKRAVQLFKLRHKLDELTTPSEEISPVPKQPKRKQSRGKKKFGSSHTPGKSKKKFSLFSTPEALSSPEKNVPTTKNSKCVTSPVRSAGGSGSSITSLETDVLIRRSCINEEKRSSKAPVSVVVNSSTERWPPHKRSPTPGSSKVLSAMPKVNSYQEEQNTSISSNINYSTPVLKGTMYHVSSQGTASISISSDVSPAPSVSNGYAGRSLGQYQSNDCVSSRLGNTTSNMTNDFMDQDNGSQQNAPIYSEVLVNSTDNRDNVYISQSSAQEILPTDPTPHAATTNFTDDSGINYFQGPSTYRQNNFDHHNVKQSKRPFISARQNERASYSRGRFKPFRHHSNFCARSPYKRDTSCSSNDQSFWMGNDAQVRRMPDQVSSTAKRTYDSPCQAAHGSITFNSSQQASRRPISYDSSHHASRGPNTNDSSYYASRGLNTYDSSYHASRGPNTYDSPCQAFRGPRRYHKSRQESHAPNTCDSSPQLSSCGPRSYDGSRHISRGPYTCDCPRQASNGPRGYDRCREESRVPDTHESSRQASRRPYTYGSSRHVSRRPYTYGSSRHVSRGPYTYDSPRQASHGPRGYYSSQQESRVSNTCDSFQQASRGSRSYDSFQKESCVPNTNENFRRPSRPGSVNDSFKPEFHVPRGYVSYQPSTRVLKNISPVAQNIHNSVSQSFNDAPQSFVSSDLPTDVPASDISVNMEKDVNSGKPAESEAVSKDGCESLGPCVFELVPKPTCERTSDVLIPLKIAPGGRGMATPDPQGNLVTEDVIVVQKANSSRRIKTEPSSPPRAVISNDQCNSTTPSRQQLKLKSSCNAIDIISVDCTEETSVIDCLYLTEVRKSTDAHARQKSGNRSHLRKMSPSREDLCNDSHSKVTVTPSPVPQGHSLGNHKQSSSVKSENSGRSLDTSVAINIRGSKTYSREHLGYIFVLSDYVRESLSICKISSDLLTFDKAQAVQQVLLVLLFLRGADFYFLCNLGVCSVMAHQALSPSGAAVLTQTSPFMELRLISCEFQYLRCFIQSVRPMISSDVYGRVFTENSQPLQEDSVKDAIANCWLRCKLEVAVRDMFRSCGITTSQ